MAEPQFPPIGNRYQIRDKLGEGGMGIVFRGEDRRTGRDVAIKVLKPQAIAENPDRLERFRREAEALREIDHPNIVKILDTIQERNLYYIIMEYMEAGSLRGLLNKLKWMSLQRALNMSLDLSDALVRTHRLKIIHRDIKPSNVLLDEDGTPHLTDFGAAHFSDESMLTEPGSIIGTYHYMPPEILRGEAADARSDIWSFGVMLYEMVTGYRPFMGQRPYDLFRAIEQQPVPNMQKLRPEVPPALAELVNAMLKKPREERIFSMRQVGAQIEDILMAL